MSGAPRYRIVMDTNVIIGAGSVWVMPEPPAPLPENFSSRVVHCVTTLHEGLVCDDIILEYAEKLETFHHPPERISRYLAYLAGACENVEIVKFYCEPRPEDVDDTIFVLCAINGSAHYLISDDHHLLDIAHAYDPPKIRAVEDMRVPLLLGS
jgi:predicted nucleic acid-binding protein